MIDLNEEALNAASLCEARGDIIETQAVVAAYFASLAEQGIVLADVRDVAEWLRSDVGRGGYGGGWTCPRTAADAIEARFGGTA